MTHAAPGTPLPFEACDNFRELGGYQGLGGKHVKYGVFYRTPALANLHMVTSFRPLRWNSEAGDHGYLAI